jgi:hypothetical protein
MAPYSAPEVCQSPEPTHVGDAKCEQTLSRFCPRNRSNDGGQMPVSSTRRSAFAYSDRDHCVTVYCNTVLSFSLQPPNLRYLEAWAQSMDRLSKLTSDPIVVMTVIDSQSRPPDELARGAIRSAVDRHRHRIAAFAYVVEGGGFGAAAMRSAISLVSLAARYPFPQKVFANTAEATAWIFQRVPAESVGDASAVGIISGVEAMRHEVTRLAAVG